MNLLKEYKDRVNNKEALDSLENLIEHYEGLFCTALDKDTLIRTVGFLDQTENTLHSKIVYGTISTDLNEKINRWIEGEFNDDDIYLIKLLYSKLLGDSMKDITETTIIEILYKTIIDNQVAVNKDFYEVEEYGKITYVTKEEFDRYRELDGNSMIHLMYGMFNFINDYEGSLLKYIREI